MKNYLVKILLLFSFLGLTFSCNKKIAIIFPERPNRELKNNFIDDKDSSPEFKQGWKDGCETGMAGGSNTFYGAFYDNNKADGYKMTTSGDYANAWGAAFWYCYRVDYIKQKSTIWGSVFGGYR